MLSMPASGVSKVPWIHMTADETHVACEVRVRRATHRCWPVELDPTHEHPHHRQQDDLHRRLERE